MEEGEEFNYFSDCDTEKDVSEKLQYAEARNEAGTHLTLDQQAVCNMQMEAQKRKEKIREVLQDENK